MNPPTPLANRTAVGGLLARLKQVEEAKVAAKSAKSGLTIQQTAALTSMKQLATMNVKTIEAERAAGRCQTWREIEAIVKSPIPDRFKPHPTSTSMISYLNWRTWYREGVEQRFLESLHQQQAPPVAKPAAAASIDIEAKGWSLKPMQQKGVDQITDVFLHEQLRATVLPWGTGTGKTFGAGGAIHALKKVGIITPPRFPLFPPVLWVTKNRLIRPTERKLAIMGLTRKDVLVIAYSTLRTKKWKQYFDEVTEVRQGQPTVIYKWSALPFKLIVADEMQEIKNPDASCTQMFEGLLRAEGADAETRLIGMSATPFVTLADTRVFTIAARVEYMGEIVNNDNFKSFAKSFLRGEGYGIDDPNDAALARYREYMGRAVVSPPRDPVKTKAFNRVTLIDFPDEARRQMYKKAVDTWVEAVQRSGGNTETSMRGEILRAFGIYIGAEELCKTDWFAQRAHQHVQDGYAAVVCVRRQDSLITIVGKLAQLGYKRDQISIIWGGKKIIKESDCFTTEEFTKITLRAKEEADKKLDRGLPVGDRLFFLSKKDKAKYKKTATYNKERFFKGETKAEARTRIEWLDNMMLNQQSLEEQDDEVERFLDGKTLICVYTMSAGGVGIDLDHQRPHARPRRGIFTIGYWAEEIVQSAGRYWRPASSLTDAHGEFVFIKNTLAADNIAPSLARKVASINAMCASGLDFEDMLERAVLKGVTEGSELPFTPDIPEPEGSNEEIDEKFLEEDPDED